MSARIHAVANQKGGVGKTATAVNLAAGLAMMQRRVLLVDLDGQRNASSTLTDRDLQPSIGEVLFDGVTVAAASWPTGRAGLILVPGSARLGRYQTEDGGDLREGLALVGSGYEHIVLDCPPSLEGATEAAVASCDEVVVPVQCEYLALEGLTRLLGLLERVGLGSDGLPQVRYLLTMFDGRNNLAREVAAEVRGHFGSQVAAAVIPRSVRMAEAPGFRRTIYEHDGRGPAAHAYREFVEEVGRGGK